MNERARERRGRSQGTGGDLKWTDTHTRMKLSFTRIDQTHTRPYTHVRKHSA